MKEEDLVDSENNIDEHTMSSVDIAKVTNKRHNNVMRDIKRLFNDDIIITDYLDVNNRRKTMFILNEKQSKVLLLKYDIRFARPSTEKFMVDIIIDSYPNLGKPIKQYRIDDKFRIDLAYPEHNLFIEIDEDEHRFKQYADDLRETHISNYSQCKIIRIKEGELGKGLAEINRYLCEYHKENVVKYL